MNRRLTQACLDALDADGHGLSDRERADLVEELRQELQPYNEVEKPDALKPHIVILGSVVEGFTFIGPFAGPATAVEWADENLGGPAMWHIAPLDPSEEWSQPPNETRAHCPDCGIPTVPDREGLTDEEKLCEGCHRGQ